MPSLPRRPWTVLLVLAALAGCGGRDDDDVDDTLPQLAPATGAALSSCATLQSRLAFANTTFSAASAVAAGTLTVGGQPIAEHCRVTGQMFPRTSAVDGRTYAIGFEMRLPNAWNGRFWYQANGGTDGAISTAVGSASAGAALTNALQQGFAVLSSDAGHSNAQNPTFGIDPQARLDYGYQAVGKLTPMAQEAIRIAYGKAPDRSYLGGCSNGGRHAMVAASRYANDYDGILAGNPGTVLPRAAIANIAGYQTYASLATDPANVSTGFTVAERQLVSSAVLGRCDALDGTTDGMVQDTKACQAAFDLARDVPTCSGPRDGTCLSAAQKTGIARLFAGATTSTGAVIYASFPYDTGIATGNWTFWKFTVPPALDAGAVAHIWQVPPVDPATFNGPSFALTSSVDDLLAKVQATNAVYTESALSFMTPPNPTDLSTLRNRGAKLMIYHGTADPIFSSDHSVSVYEGLRSANGGDASNFARLFLVPGMNHCGGGPSTDQFDMITPLVDWVERGIAPASVTAAARGPGNPAAVNADLPSTWAANRTRPLCPYPLVARYRGSGDVEQAASFECRP
ncbi:MAG TPA: tannase/feruloyl esterase family alpha/beta hydrolase [Caldimonas sp.]|jgi:feruloyl esterase|nr:tannase/feruloyl esterase family alpha/beta hydrolase [Caldimonas sp.]HEX2539455.1 tannase/feruloyl esterase family alpha/beta hydrolase [Caldimonas sp.]